VVLRLVDAGREVRVLSRHPRPARHYESVAVDLVDGTGLDVALSGVDTVVHCASRRNDAVAAKNLIAAAERAGVPHPHRPDVVHTAALAGDPGARRR
jgi:uncharacterized protein YbjT (DUF2867 family)